MYTILFICCKATINDLKKVFKNTFTSDIIKHIIIKYNNCIMPKLDYKYPIEMKKYMFESMRIMPKDLTRLTSKEQRCLSINISIARELGLIDRSK